MGKKNNTQVIVVGLVATAASVGLLLWYVSEQKKKQQAGLVGDGKKKKKDRGLDVTPKRTNKSSSSSSAAAASIGSSTTAAATTSGNLDDKEIHLKIEELDKKGKVHFKNKEFLEAAQAFTDALDFLENNCTEMSKSMQRQHITLLNNRSAMYEKANMMELGLEDCAQILELELDHQKARTRKLRILESLKRYDEALIEVCATQLLFMREHRTQLKMGLPIPSPPIPQTKMEEILNMILPDETETYVQKLLGDKNTSRLIPGPYTILQLLKSYTNYNSWMAQSAKDGNTSTLTKAVDQAVLPSDKAYQLLKRGQRYVYERKYVEATSDFEAAFALVEKDEAVGQAMPDDSYARLLEWTGMERHWHFNLESALELLKKATTLEADNALLLVKQAGVQLDAGQHDESLKLFEQALVLDPDAVDALLHRANLRIMQGKPELAKSDLEKCIRLRPDHVMARLRLASVLVPMENMPGAQKQLDKARATEPDSSEVQSYQGELLFAQGQMDEARRHFEKAIELEPNNPTPYVNAAMAMINTPPSAPGQMPDTNKILSLLEKAIQVDPQFTAAYVHLGQLKLGTATDLDSARAVVDLYDQGLENCRSSEEIKELVSMRILAKAQVDAATMLKMETFSMN